MSRYFVVRGLLLGLCLAFFLPAASHGQDAGGGTGIGCVPIPDPLGLLGGKCTCDSQCNDGKFCTGQERCAPSQVGADARGCVRTAACTAGQICNEATDRCEIDQRRDNDGDGSDALNDCDDNDARRHPGAVEVCDPEGVDEDCDASTYGHRDLDHDGHDDAQCRNVEYR